MCTVFIWLWTVASGGLLSHANEITGSIKGRQFLIQLSNYLLLWILLVRYLWIWLSKWAREHVSEVAEHWTLSPHVIAEMYRCVVLQNSVGVLAEEWHRRNQILKLQLLFSSDRFVRYMSTRYDMQVLRSVEWNVMIMITDRESRGIWKEIVSELVLKRITWLRIYTKMKVCLGTGWWRESSKLRRCKQRTNKSLHNEKLHNMYSSPNIIRAIKSGHVARTGNIRASCNILVGIPVEKRSRCRWEVNIKTDF
jgi:hypothetical protein